MSTEGGPVTAPDGSGIPGSRSTPGQAAPAWRPDQLLGAKHDTPDQTGAVIDFEPIAEDSRSTPGPGQAAYDPLRCPACGSPQPSLHPAVSGGGEVTRLCKDPFHGTIAAAAPAPAAAHDFSCHADDRIHAEDCECRCHDEQPQAAPELADEITRLQAQAEIVNGLIRDTLEALCRRDGLSLESAVNPGEPAANYELGDRLGIGHVFGLPDAAAPAPAALGPFTTPPGFHLITDNSGTRHLVDVGGVRYLTEERPGSWELAIRSGNWPALVQLARNILGTTEADL